MPDEPGMTTVTQFRRPGNAWMGELSRGHNGPHPTAANTIIVLGNDDELSGLLAYDEFAYRAMVTRPPPLPYLGANLAPGPYPRPLNDSDVTLIQSYVQRTYDMRIGLSIAQQATEAAAEQRRYHPVRDWLAGLRWDRKPRLDTWLHTAFGTPNDGYHRAVAVKFLVAAVRRVRQPGCKYDSMPVMEGLQEIGKSTSCRALFGAQWFSDEMPDMRSREAPISMLGVWGVEVAELGAILRTELEVVKAFLTRQVDRYREVHGRRYVERPRQGMLIGTTNETDYLRDTTGNRRFWPFYCYKAEPGWIEDHREQLWAEAVSYDDEKEVLWLDDGHVRESAQRMQAERVEEDAWTLAIRAHVYDGMNGPLTSVRLPDLMRNALGLASDKQNRSAQMRLAAILRSEGWTVRVVWQDNRSTRIWTPPPQAP